MASLEQIVASGGTIYQANSKAEWPGSANVYYCMVCVARSEWSGHRILDGREVEEVSSYLTALDTGDANCHWQPVPLAANAKLAFYGAIPNGTGFFLEREEAETLLRQKPSRKDILLPFLIGKDLNSASQVASRFAIIFWNWSEDRARKEDPELFGLVAERVKQYRQTLAAKKPKLARYWWLYEANPRGLHEALGRAEFFENGGRKQQTEPLERVLVIARVSSTTAFTFVSPGQVFDCALIIVASEDAAVFAVLQSSIHLAFAWQYGGKMKSDLRYSPTLCIGPFPFPESKAMTSLASVGQHVHDTRQELLQRRGIGLTDLAKLVNDASVSDSDVVSFRSQLAALDGEVLSAYGWQDLGLEHGFHRPAYLPQGRSCRFTISEVARVEVLRRLAELNRQRSEEEQAEGTKHSTKGRAKVASSEQGALTHDGAGATDPGSRTRVASSAKRGRGRRTSR